MVDRNIKPVSQIARSIPLRIGGQYRQRRPFADALLEAADGGTAKPGLVPAAGTSRAGDDLLNLHGPSVAPATYEPPAPEPAASEASADDVFQQAREQGVNQGRREGRDEGYEAGYAAGLAEGRKAAAQVRQAEQAYLQTVITALLQPLDVLRDDIANSATEGAQQLAQLLVGAAFSIDPEIIRHTLVEIIKEAAANNRPGAHLRLHVAASERPAADALIHSLSSDDMPVDVITDDQLSPGDAQATLVYDNGDPANQIEWDARLETRWTTIRQALKTPRR